ncbi:MAG: thioredoxin family protein [Pseudomonadota bacterium]
MQRTTDVLIIGTEPPCPRCDILGILVKEGAPPSVVINLKHCAFDSLEAGALAQKIGCKIGTAKHVARDAGVPMDWDVVHKLIEEKKSGLSRNYRPADAWSPELDRALEPCQRVAESAGYLMTPVLIVNEKVVHHGSVPSKTQITKWLSE